MPVHHPRVRRMRVFALQAIPRARRVAPHAPDQSGRAHRAAGDRQPDDRLSPQRRVPSERREIQPVQHRAGVTPSPGASGRSHDRLARRIGDVDNGSVRIVDREAVQRKRGARHTGQRPLIGLLEKRVIACPRRRVAGERGGDRDGAAALDAVEHVAAVGEHGDRFACRRQSVHGSSFERRQVYRRRSDAADANGISRRNADRLGSNRRQPRKPVGAPQFRHARVHHHDAGREPGEEQQTSADPEPAMRIDQRAAHSTPILTDL